MRPLSLTHALALLLLVVGACSRDPSAGCGSSRSDLKLRSELCFDPDKALEPPPDLGYPECSLEKVWKACQNENLGELFKISENESACPIERALAAYAHYRLSPKRNPKRLFAVVPTDSESVEWMRYGYPEPYELYRAVQEVAMPLALEGDRSAIRLMLKGWVEYSEGEWLDYVCPVVAADLLERRPRLTIEVASRERAGNITICVAYSLAANDEWAPRIEQIRRMQFESPAAAELRDDIVDAYYYVDPDWP